MTPKQAKDILSVIEELSTPEGCQPYVDVLWSDAEEAKHPSVTWNLPDPEQNARMIEASKFSNQRKKLPAAIAETMDALLQGTHPDGKRAELGEPEIAVLKLACQKKGISFSAMMQPAHVIPLRNASAEALEEFFQQNDARPKAPIESSDDGRVFIDTSAVQAIAEQYRSGGRELGV